jgi:hypothetical protein
VTRQSDPIRVHGVHDNADGKGTPSGCGFYRIVLPFDELGRHGHQVSYAAGEPKIPDGCQVIVGQRFDNPDVLKFWRRLRARVRTVYEIDDDIWHVPRANWLAFKTYNWDHSRDAVETAAAMADIVTVTTEPLAEILRKFNPEVRVVPNVIPGALLDWKHDDPNLIKVAGKDARQVRIGWRGGASHALDVQMIATPVRNVLRKNPQSRLHVIGTDFRPTFGVDADYTDWVPVKPDLEFYKTLTGIDVGLAPLYGIEFDRSKSPIAAMEYAAFGIPTIASYSEAYRDFIVDGKTGYLIRRKSDWAKRISELVNDHEAREAMGAAAKERVRAWTVESEWPNWLNVYKELVR